MQVHPAATLFPLMVGDELAELADDIEANGQRETIKLLDGAILDGRNRFAACQAKGIEPRFEDLPPDTDPVAYVISLNVKRRNLSASQRAISAAEAWELYGGQEHAGRPSKSARLGRIPGDTRERLAELFGVGKNSVQQARALVERDPGVAEAVKAGERSLNGAYAALLVREGAPVPDEVYTEVGEVVEIIEARHGGVHFSPILVGDLLEDWYARTQRGTNARGRRRGRPDRRVEGREIRMASAGQTRVAYIQEALTEALELISTGMEPAERQKIIVRVLPLLRRAVETLEAEVE